jgi:transcriptional regulator with XRE-family HTH domain
MIHRQTKDIAAILREGAAIDRAIEQAGYRFQRNARAIRGRMSTRKTKKIPRDADALRMLETLTRNDAAMEEMLAEERSNAAVARQIYELRTAGGLTQQPLADLIGTQQPVIARLEDADYRGHSLAMLYRIGAALGCRVAVGFVPRSATTRRKSRRASTRPVVQRCAVGDVIAYVPERRRS